MGCNYRKLSCNSGKGHVSALRGRSAVMEIYGSPLQAYMPSVHLPNSLSWDSPTEVLAANKDPSFKRWSCIWHSEHAQIVGVAEATSAANADGSIIVSFTNLFVAQNIWVACHWSGWVRFSQLPLTLRIIWWPLFFHTHQMSVKSLFNCWN